MIRKLLLLVCIVLAVVAFGYPCVIIPFGSYDYNLTSDGITQKYSYSFKFNQEVVLTQYNVDTGEELSQTTMYYKLKGNKVIISADKTFDKNDKVLAIASIYRLGDTSFNVYGCAAAIGIAVVATALVITLPRKKY